MKNYFYIFIAVFVLQGVVHGAEPSMTSNSLTVEAPTDGQKYFSLHAVEHDLEKEEVKADTYPNSKEDWIRVPSPVRVGGHIASDERFGLVPPRPAAPTPNTMRQGK